MVIQYSLLYLKLAQIGNSLILFILFYFVFLLFLWAAPRHMEVPRLGVESELQPPAYTRATAMRDPSHVGSEPRLQPTPQLTATPDR